MEKSNYSGRSILSLRNLLDAFKCNEVHVYEKRGLLQLQNGEAYKRAPGGYKFIGKACRTGCDWTWIDA